MTDMCPHCGKPGLDEIDGIPHHWLCGWVQTIPASAATIDIAALRIENERFMAENRFRPREKGEHLAANHPRLPMRLYPVICCFCGKSSQQELDGCGKVPRYCDNGTFADLKSCRHKYKLKRQRETGQYGSWEKRKGKK